MSIAPTASSPKSSTSSILSDITSFADWEALHPGSPLAEENSREPSVLREYMARTERVWRDRDSSNDARSSGEEDRTEEKVVVKVKGGKKEKGKSGKEIPSSMAETNSQGRSQDWGPDFEAPPSSQPRPESSDEEEEDGEGNQGVVIEQVQADAESTASLSEDEQEFAAKEDNMEIDIPESASRKDKKDQKNVTNPIKLEGPRKGDNPLLARRDTLTLEEYKRLRKYKKKARMRLRKEIQKQLGKDQKPKQKPKPTLTERELENHPTTVLRSGKAIDLDPTPDPEGEDKIDIAVELAITKAKKKARKTKNLSPTTSAHFSQPANTESTSTIEDVKKDTSGLPENIKQMMAQAAKAVEEAAAVIEQTVETNTKIKADKLEKQRIKSEKKNAKIKANEVENQTDNSEKKNAKIEADEVEKPTGDSEQKKKKRKRDRNQNRLEAGGAKSSAIGASQEKATSSKPTIPSNSKATATTEESAKWVETGEPALKKRRRDRGRKSESKQDKDVQMVEAAQATIHEGNDSAPAVTDQASQPDAEPMSVDVDMMTTSKKAKKSKKKVQSQETQAQETNNLGEETPAEAPVDEPMSVDVDTLSKEETKSKKKRKRGLQVKQSQDQVPTAKVEPIALDIEAEVDAPAKKVKKSKKEKRQSQDMKSQSQVLAEATGVEEPLNERLDTNSAKDKKIHKRDQTKTRTLKGGRAFLDNIPSADDNVEYHYEYEGSGSDPEKDIEQAVLSEKMNEAIPRGSDEEFHDYEHEPADLSDIDDIINDGSEECAPLRSGLPAYATGTTSRTNAPNTIPSTISNAAMQEELPFQYVESESSFGARDSPEINDSDADNDSIQVDDPVQRGRKLTIAVEIPAYVPLRASPSPILPSRKRTASLTRDSNGRFATQNGESSKKRSKSRRPPGSIPLIRSRQVLSQERNHSGRFSAKSASPSRTTRPRRGNVKLSLQADLKFLTSTSWGISSSEKPSGSESVSIIRPPVTRSSKGKFTAPISSSVVERSASEKTETPILPPPRRISSGSFAPKISSTSIQPPVSSRPVETPIRPPPSRTSIGRSTSETSSIAIQQSVPSRPVETPIRPPPGRNSTGRSTSETASTTIRQPIPPKPVESVIRPPPPTCSKLKRPDSTSSTSTQVNPSKPTESVIRPPPRKYSMSKNSPGESTSITKPGVPKDHRDEEFKATQNKPGFEMALKPEKKKRQPAKSPFFAMPTKAQKPKASKASQPQTPNADDNLTSQSSPKKRTPAKTVSCIPFPPLSATNFGIIQEKLAHDPFRLLIAVTFLIRTHGKHAIPIFFELMERYPTPEALANADKQDVVSIIRHLGLQNQRADTYKLYAKIWLDEPPTKGKRYPVRGYPDLDSGRNCQLNEILTDEDERHAWEIGHMTNGPYALDSWRIFCRDKLRGVAESWNGEGNKEEGFQPEWMRVVPEDKELRAYLRWMWLKDGFEWDPFTGDKEVARPELMMAAIEGRIAWDDAGGMRILESGERAGGVVSQTKGLRDIGEE